MVRSYYARTGEMMTANNYCTKMLAELQCQGSNQIKVLLEIICSVHISVNWKSSKAGLHCAQLPLTLNIITASTSI